MNHVFRRLVEQQQRQALMATVPPTRCAACGHARISHTRQTGQCWSTACGCRTFREDATK